MVKHKHAHTHGTPTRMQTNYLDKGSHTCGARLRQYAQIKSRIIYRFPFGHKFALSLRPNRHSTWHKRLSTACRTSLPHMDNTNVVSYPASSSLALRKQNAHDRWAGGRKKTAAKNFFEICTLYKKISTCIAMLAIDKRHDAWWWSWHGSWIFPRSVCMSYREVFGSLSVCQCRCVGVCVWE